MKEKVKWYQWIVAVVVISFYFVLFLFQVKNINMALGCALTYYAYSPSWKQAIKDFLAEERQSP